MGEILIGTSGFSYDDWRGHVYPEEIQKGDMLAYYARTFPAVEVNSSFYAIPAPMTFARMAQKTPEGFRFVVKVNKDLTHSPGVDVSLFKTFSASIEPLVQAGKLGCLLAQYPWSFRKNQINADRLRQLREEFAGFPIVVEFRNAGWVTRDTFDVLRNHNLGFCCVDEPRLRGLMPDIAVYTSAVGYVRFHGRNAEKWWQHDEAWQRYDYLYTANELRSWEPKVRKLVENTDATYLFFNNHYKGKAAQNAQLFAGMLGVQLPKQSDSGSSP